MWPVTVSLLSFCICPSFCLLIVYNPATVTLQILLSFDTYFILVLVDFTIFNGLLFWGVILFSLYIYISFAK